MTLSEAVLEWLEKYKKTSIKPTSYDRLLTSLQVMDHYEIADIQREDLTVDEFQEYLNDLVEDGYALTTIKKQYSLLAAYIKHANVVGDIQRPIYNAVRMPTQSVVYKPKKDIQAYTDEEQEALCKILNSGERDGYFAALMMLETGMRVGEVLALDWSDILWNRKAVHIHRTMVRIANKKQSYIQNEPKSHSSNRIVPLSSRAMDILKKLPKKSSGRIFEVSYEALRWQIGKACEKAHVRYLGQHVFRHTFATNCYNRGCDVKILSKLLGHADVAITYNTYIHLFGDALEEMRAVVE